MSRAMNLTTPRADVEAYCLSAGQRISAIEDLPTGGTHVVCTTIEEADAVRRKFAKQVIEGRVRRYPFFNLRASQ